MEMPFAIRRRPLPFCSGIFLPYFFFLLQLNLTYIKRILYLVKVKNIGVTSSSSDGIFMKDISVHTAITLHYCLVFLVALHTDRCQYIPPTPREYKPARQPSS